MTSQHASVLARLEQARFIRRAALALAMIAFAARGLAQQTATSQSAQSLEQLAAEARAWVAAPARQSALEAFAPALDLRYREYDAARPLRLWLAKIDLTQPGVGFVLTEPTAFEGPDAPYDTRCANTLEFAEQRHTQLAINTSAFRPFRGSAGLPMDVVGLAAVAGRTYSEPDERFGALYVAQDGRVSLKGPPPPQDALWHVVPGFRMLLDDGRLAVAEDVARSRFGGVNPRTAVGADRASHTLWVVVADGRQPGVSEGITLVELACLFESLGCWDALNLDGGGSSTLVVQGADGSQRVLNTPVGRGAPGTLRQVANNLGLRLPGDGLR